jgi:hypothetical protein
MTRLALIALLAAPAAAQDVRTWPGYYAGADASTARLHAPTEPNAAATLTFHNTTVHQGDEVFSLTWESITIEVRFHWQAGGTQAESLTIIPPAGYIALPDVLTVDEDATGVAHLYEYRGN